MVAGSRPLGDLVFRLEESRSDQWELGEDCFRFYKNRQLVEQFERFWSARNFRPRRMLEIGIWDGGSTAFWYELLRPERMVAIVCSTATTVLTFAAI